VSDSLLSAVILQAVIPLEIVLQIFMHIHLLTIILYDAAQTLRLCRWLQEQDQSSSNVGSLVHTSMGFGVSPNLDRNQKNMSASEDDREELGVVVQIILDKSITVARLPVELFSNHAVTTTGRRIAETNSGQSSTFEP
jgi:hypothetical protein